jgi:hypothetical protein
MKESKQRRYLSPFTVSFAFMFCMCQFMMVQVTQAMYFYATPNDWRCF